MNVMPELYVRMCVFVFHIYDTWYRGLGVYREECALLHNVRLTCVAHLWYNLESDREDCGKQRDRRGKTVCNCVCDRDSEWERGGLLMIFTAAIKAPLSWWIIIFLIGGFGDTHSHTHEHAQSLALVSKHARIRAHTGYQPENGIRVCVSLCVHWPPDTQCRAWTSLPRNANVF